LGAANALKLRVKDLMILHSHWTLVLQEKFFFLTGVIVLIDNINRDKQLNTACNLESPVAITLSQVLFKLYSWKSV